MGVKTWWIAAVVAAALMAGSACTTKTLNDVATGDSSTTSTTTSTISSITSGGGGIQGSTPKVTFLAQGNAICADMNKRSEAVGAVTSDPNITAVQLADALDQSVQIMTESVASLRALAQPPGDEAKLAAMYADVDALISTAQQMVAAVRALDRPTMQTLATQLDTQQATTNREFNDYGLVECGQ